MMEQQEMTREEAVKEPLLLTATMHIRPEDSNREPSIGPSQ